MPSGHVFMAMSLDGFVARTDHALDWLMKQKTEHEDHGYDAFMANVDGLFMGSGSLKTVLSFDVWPYQKPVVVMSHSMTAADIPAELRHKIRFTRQTPSEAMSSLEADGWKRVYIDGGKIIQSFLRARLIDDITLTIVPILIGSGVRLFGPLESDIDLKLLESKSHKSGLLTAKYAVLSP